MREGMVILKDSDTLKKYVHLTEGFENATIPTSNSADNGSVPGMMRFLCGGAGDDFNAMACRVQDWLAENK
jgi:hypothetical protein